MNRFITQRSVTNDLTGEVVHSETHVIKTTRMDKEPAYVKMYINDIGLWQGLSTGETNKIGRAHV